jgi:hypothetical protein
MKSKEIIQKIDNGDITDVTQIRKLLRKQIYKKYGKRIQRKSKHWRIIFNNGLGYRMVYGDLKNSEFMTNPTYSRQITSIEVITVTCFKVNKRGKESISTHQM